MKTIEKVIEIGTKIKTYNDYHSTDEVIQDIDDMFGLLKDVEREYNGLYKKYQKVLELSKENADSYEYTLRDLEKELDDLQAENEQLKNNIELMAKYNDENFAELLKCRKENEELKEQLSGKTFFCENCEKLARESEEFKATADDLLKIQYALADSCNKYSKALEEIKEYASAIEKEELIAGYAIRAKSALWRIVKKINEVLK